MTVTKLYDFFISHSAKDATLANELCTFLEKNGICCWIAPRNINLKAGSSYGQNIIEGIRGSAGMIIIFNADANESPFIAHEIERAFHYKLPIIPFRIDESEPKDSLELFLSPLHWLTAQGNDPRESFHLLLTACYNYIGDRGVLSDTNLDEQARLHMKTGDFATALSKINELLKRNPDNSAAAACKWDILKAEELSRETRINKLFRENVDNALQAFHKEQFDIAIDCIREALILKPEDGPAINLLKEITDAKDIFQQADIDKKANLHFEHATVLLRDLNYRKATEEISSAILLKPEERKYEELRKDIDRTRSQINSRRLKAAGVIGLLLTGATLIIYLVNTNLEKRKIVYKNSYYGLENGFGYTIAAPQFNFLEERDSWTITRYAAKDSNSKWGLINSDGQICIPFKYDELEIRERDSYAAVRVGKLWGIVNVYGNEIVPVIFPIAHLAVSGDYVELYNAGQQPEWSYARPISQFIDETNRKFILDSLLSLQFSNDTISFEMQTFQK